MTTLITSNLTGSSTTPEVVLGWSATNDERSITHKLIGGGVAVSITTPDPDNGTADLLYATRSDAFAARNLLLDEGTFSLTNGEVTEIEMTFTVGSVGVELWEDGERWQVTFSWQKVDPE